MGVTHLLPRSVVVDDGPHEWPAGEFGPELFCLSAQWSPFERRDGVDERFVDRVPNEWEKFTGKFTTDESLFAMRKAFPNQCEHSHSVVFVEPLRFGHSCGPRPRSSLRVRGCSSVRENG